MLSYIIEGGRKLEGTIEVSVSKNASLPILAACILSPKTTLYNVPKIYDTEKTLQILQILNCKIKRGKNKIIIDSTKTEDVQIPDKLMRELRSSVILARSTNIQIQKSDIFIPWRMRHRCKTNRFALKWIQKASE